MRIRDGKYSDPGSTSRIRNTDRKTVFFESIMEKEQIKKTGFLAVVYMLADLSAKSVSRIHEILVRFRICVSIPLTNGSGSCYFRLCPSNRLQKIIEGTFTSFFKDKWS
jgi:hypothetical protein